MKKLLFDKFVLAIIVFVALFLSTLGVAQAIEKGRVMKVTDGDTVAISLAEGGQFYKCRLYGIDAPETPKHGKPGQPFGEEATKELKRLILGQDVDVEIKDTDRYRRKVCRISKGGMDVNLEMVKLGFAWAYVHYLRRPYASEYIDAERSARAKKLGLWQQSNPQPPWEFRRLRRG